MSIKLVFHSIIEYNVSVSGGITASKLILFLVLLFNIYLFYLFNNLFNFIYFNIFV